MLTPGTEVGGYRIEGLLGRGGMGIVYEATQNSLGRRVALKLLAAELSLDPSFRSRFQREGRIQANLDHAHIVPIYEAGELEDHGLFIAMRLVRGGTLKQLVREGELDGGRLVTILRPVADALDTAHEANLVHRDIKPQNILVGRRDHAYLADFGLTRAPGDTAFTKTGQFVGTLDYIAPEQIRGEPPTAASDLYSLAAVACECLTGSVPFPRPNEASVLFAHMSDPPPRPSELTPGLPAAVDDVIAAGMAKSPADRPPTVLDFVDALQSALGSAGAGLSLAPPPPPAELFGPDSGTHVAAAAGASTQAPAPAESTVPARGRAADTPAAVETAAAAAAPTTVAREGPAPAEPGRDEDPGEPTDVRSRIGASTQADRRRPWPPGAAAADPPVAATDPPVAAKPAAPPAPAPAPPSAPVPTPAARAAEPASRRRSAGRLRLTAAGVVAALAVAGGLLAGGAGEEREGNANAAPEPTAEPRAALTAGAIALRGPAGWDEGDAPEVSGLDLRKGSALTGDDGALLAGMTDAGGATLLPAKLLRNLVGDGVRADSVRLGDAAAYRYRGLTLRDAEDPITVLVVPTKAGVATVACTGTEAAQQSCEGAASSLRLDAEPYPLGPRPGYAEDLRAAVGRLREARARATRSWRRADTRAGQARAAERVRAAYGAAARAVGKLNAAPLERDAQRALQRSLASTADAYDGLGRAAGAGSENAYQDARTRVRTSENAVRGALERYADLGYRVR